MFAKNAAFYFASPATTQGVDSGVDDWVEVEGEVDVPLRPTFSDAENNFYSLVAEAASKRVPSGPVLQADLERDTLWDIWLENIEPQFRQKFTCHCCERFMNTYGGLVQIDNDGIPQSLFWTPSEDVKVPKVLQKSVEALHAKLKTVKVIGVTATTPTKNGKRVTPKTAGGFFHLYFEAEVLPRKQQPTGFATASTDELATMLTRVLSDYSRDTVRKAHLMLTEDKLPYGDNHKGSIRWLYDIHTSQVLDRAADETTRHNLIYRYAASSWVGAINQMRSGALSTLLDDIEADKSFDTIKRQWTAINDPMQYLRPQVAPSAGHIAAAERLMAELGVTENDMRRRQLTHSEVPENVVTWRSADSASKATTENLKPVGVFGKLQPRQGKPMSNKVQDSDMPATRISFTKLMTDVLPQAKKLEYKVDERAGLCFCITGFENTKPLMLWHNDTNRASWFFYHRPDPVKNHNLKGNDWNEVQCIIPYPHLWNGAPHTTTFPLAASDSELLQYYHKKEGFRYLFCLKGVELNEARGLCLFPELLKGEFHGVRRTIEAYSNKSSLDPVPQIEDKGGLVAGMPIGRSTKGGQMLRVTGKDGFVRTYQIVLFE